MTAPEAVTRAGEPTGPSFTLAAGAHVGRYQVVRGLARGGMGEVYLARMSVAGGYKLVALKRMLPGHLDNADGRAMFVREASVALRLDHSGVVQVLDILEEAEAHAIVMEYIHGRSARDILRQWREDKRGPRSMGTAIAIVIGAATALQYVHEVRDENDRLMGLVHRDVSPENIMVRFDGGTKLIDFGIARISAVTAATNTGVLKGKVGYMSPEQIRQDPLDRRSDVFQLGLVLFELTTGRRSFAGDNFASVMNAVLSGETPSPRTVVADYPEALCAIVERALAYEPEDRYANAGALGAALAEFAATHDIAVSTDVTAAELARLFGSPAAPRTDANLIDAGPAPTKAPGGVTASLRATGAIVLAAAAGLGALATVERVNISTAPSENLALAHHERSQWFGATGGALAILGVALLARRRRWTRGGLVAIATLTAATTGCTAPEYRCTDGRVCDARPGGWCDPATMHCAYPDPSCEPAARYSPLAGELADQCTPQQGSDEPTVYAWRIAEPVTLDGDPRELQIGAPLHLTSDFGVSGDLWVGWNDEGLYLGASIQDPNVEGSRGAHELLWDEDGIEAMFDTGWDRAAGSMPGPDDFKFVVTAINVSNTSWGGIEPRTAWAHPIQSAAVVRGTANQPTDADEGYSLELFVPWNEKFVKPAIGTGWGANFRINDHYAGEPRDLTWISTGRFNHPADAGILGFADREIPTTLVGPPTTASARDPFEQLPLLRYRVADSENFDPEQPVDRLFDDCIATRSNCASGTEQDQEFWVRFDLGQPHILASARLFGDTQHEWVSRAWSLRYRLEDTDPWTIAFSQRTAFMDAWAFEALGSAVARHIEVAVSGDPGKGVEATELEIYGRLLVNSASAATEEK